jgi:hypothetical protein
MKSGETGLRGFKVVSYRHMCCFVAVRQPGNSRYIERSCEDALVVESQEEGAGRCWIYHSAFVGAGSAYA